MHYVRLDITDDSSVKHFAATLQAEYGGVTVLVNNAGLSMHKFHGQFPLQTGYLSVPVLAACCDPGFAYKGNVFGADEADKTIGVNYRGTRAVCEAVQPLLTQISRIVNVSSRSGLLKILQSDSLRQKADSATSLQTVDELAEEFVARIRADK